MNKIQRITLYPGVCLKSFLLKNKIDSFLETKTGLCLYIDFYINIKADLGKGQKKKSDNSFGLAPIMSVKLRLLEYFSLDVQQKVFLKLNPVSPSSACFPHPTIPNEDPWLVPVIQ